MIQSKTKEKNVRLEKNNRELVGMRAPRPVGVFEGELDAPVLRHNTAPDANGAILMINTSITSLRAKFTPVDASTVSAPRSKYF